MLTRSRSRRRSSLLSGIGAAALAFRGAGRLLLRELVFPFSPLAGLLGFGLALKAARSASELIERAASALGLLLSSGLVAFWIWFWMNFEPS